MVDNQKLGASLIGARFGFYASSKHYDPSSIYICSLSHILEHEFFRLDCLGSQGSKEKKVDLSFSEQLLRMFFSTFCWQKKLKSF